MTLDAALKHLSEVAEYIQITYGKHVYREGFEPHYKWEVIAMRYSGECYPPFDQKDDLLEAIMRVTSCIEHS